MYYVACYIVKIEATASTSIVCCAMKYLLISFEVWRICVIGQSASYRHNLVWGIFFYQHFSSCWNLVQFNMCPNYLLIIWVFLLYFLVFRGLFQPILRQKRLLFLLLVDAMLLVLSFIIFIHNEYTYIYFL